MSRGGGEGFLLEVTQSRVERLNTDRYSHGNICDLCEYIRRAQVKVGLINLCKGLFSLNVRTNYPIVHRQAVCNLPGCYSTILPHKAVHCSN
jgi:hypothetical protein